MIAYHQTSLDFANTNPSYIYVELGLLLSIVHVEKLNFPRFFANY